MEKAVLPSEAPFFCGTVKTVPLWLFCNFTKRADDIRPYGWNVGFYRNVVGATLAVAR